MTSILPYVTMTAILATAVWFTVFIILLETGVRETRAWPMPNLDEVGFNLFFAVKVAFIVGIATLIFFSVFFVFL